jgi:hypothetical protein
MTADAPTPALPRSTEGGRECAAHMRLPFTMPTGSHTIIFP